MGNSIGLAARFDLDPFSHVIADRFPNSLGCTVDVDLTVASQSNFDRAFSTRLLSLTDHLVLS
jgi:hypothetical protein